MKRINFVLLAALLAGCGSTSGTLTGVVDGDSFPSSVSGVVAVDDSGEESLAVLASDGSFALSVAEEATYALFVETSDGRVPVGLRVTGASYGSTLRLGMGAPTADLGSLRYVSRITTKAETVPVEETCVDGVLSESGSACLEQAATVTCEDGMDGDGDGHHGRHHGKRGGHGESEAELVDVTLETANAIVLPTLSLPLSVGCGC
jgi:hypothetical protein